jgi:hypothetical protein
MECQQRQVAGSSKLLLQRASSINDEGICRVSCRSCVRARTACRPCGSSMFRTRRATGNRSCTSCRHNIPSRCLRSGRGGSCRTQAPKPVLARLAECLHAGVGFFVQDELPETLKTQTSSWHERQSDDLRRTDGVGAPMFPVLPRLRVLPITPHGANTRATSTAVKY